MPYRSRVVVIEDSVDIAMMVEALLRERGYSVLLLANAQEIADYRDSVQWDRTYAVFVDLMLPAISGVEILQWLKATHPEIRRIAVSAMPEPPQEALEAADVFIAKPFWSDDLTGALDD